MAGPIGEVWVLGATGRIGRSVAARLVGHGVAPVLVGRRRARLEELATGLGLATGAAVVADGADTVAAAIRERRPAVVVNLLGDYARTAAVLTRALPPGGHYVDLAADPSAVPQLLDRHEDALAAGSAWVTGAGFGVLAVEAVVAALCADRATPAHVRVDALASVATEAGAVGPAYAASIVEVLTHGGLRYENGQLVRARLGADAQTLALPDGETVRTAGAPTAELHAAQRASGAPSVVATSAMAPSAPLVRAVLPLAGALLSVPALRRTAVRRLAAVTTGARPRPREHSWGHAVVTWPDGTVREGWLRAGDGMDYTAAVATEVAVRLARGDGRPGAFTPAAAFGAELAESAGGTFLLDQG